MIVLVAIVAVVAFVAGLEIGARLARKQIFSAAQREPTIEQICRENKFRLHSSPVRTPNHEVGEKGGATRS